MSDKIKCLDTNNEKYPNPLRNMHDPPSPLYAIGNLPKNSTPLVAIVGSRKPSNYGIAVTNMICGRLTASGVGVVSGLAYGIDSAAHKATLEHGGLTIAVLPAELTKVYPKRHQQLADTIVATGGALIGEYPEGVSPRKHHFIARNRIVAGLSRAVIVIEAGLKSGTMSTVGFALDLGLPVFAVPGPITSPLSQGTNYLIQQGAQLLTNPDAILHEIGVAPVASVQKNTAEHQLYIDAIAAGATTAQDIANTTNSTLSDCLSTLTKLELRRLVVRDTSGRYTIICHT